MNIIDELMFYFEFPFVRYALIVGILVALCASLLGVTLVLKRYSFIGDGLSHVAFGAMAVGTVVNMTNNTFLVMGVTIAAAIIILAIGDGKKLKGDAAIAMLSVSALAIGYMVMSVFSTAANVSGDVCSTLFGSISILTLTKSEVILCIVMSVVVIGIFVVFYNRIFATTFDENFMKASGMKVNWLNILIAVITAVIIVLAMNLVGSLLVTALIIFPALSAMRVAASFKGVVMLSAGVSVACAVIGIIVSILASTPVGATIVIIDLLVYLVFSLVGKLRVAN